MEKWQCVNIFAWCSVDAGYGEFLASLDDFELNGSKEWVVKTDWLSLDKVSIPADGSPRCIRLEARIRPDLPRHGWRDWHFLVVDSRFLQANDSSKLFQRNLPIKIIGRSRFSMKIDAVDRGIGICISHHGGDVDKILFHVDVLGTNQQKRDGVLDQLVSSGECSKCK